MFNSAHLTPTESAGGGSAEEHRRAGLRPVQSMTVAEPVLRRPLMLIFLGVLITLTTALVVRKVRVSGRADAANLGEVSEQWLAEHRASHPL